MKLDDRNRPTNGIARMEAGARGIDPAMALVAHLVFGVALAGGCRLFSANV